MIYRSSYRKVLILCVRKSVLFIHGAVHEISILSVRIGLQQRLWRVCAYAYAQTRQSLRCPHTPKATSLSKMFYYKIIYRGSYRKVLILCVRKYVLFIHGAVHEISVLSDRIGMQRRLWQVCAYAYAQTCQSLRCSHRQSRDINKSADPILDI